MATKFIQGKTKAQILEEQRIAKLKKEALRQRRIQKIKSGVRQRVWVAAIIVAISSYVALMLFITDYQNAISRRIQRANSEITRLQEENNKLNSEIQVRTSQTMIAEIIESEGLEYRAENIVIIEDSNKQEE